MSDWRSCENCHDNPICYTINGVLINYKKEQLQFRCQYWQPIECKRCGGALSTTREHNGKKYRHCYACHSEFFEEDGT